MIPQVPTAYSTADLPGNATCQAEEKEQRAWNCTRPHAKELRAKATPLKKGHGPRPPTPANDRMRHKR